MASRMTFASSKDNEDQPPCRARVLVLDDEPENLALRTAILRQHGYDCVPARSIEDASQYLDQIDIAVLDYHLGSGQFGTEVATTLRRRRPPGAS